MRLAVAVVDGTQSEESVRTWVREDVPLVVVAADDPVALSGWTQVSSATHVVVLTRPETHSQAKLQTTIAAGQYPQVAFSVLEREVPLLALAACGMTALESRADSTEVVAQLQSMLETTHAGVWLRRVHRLRAPQPKFTQHLRSMLPGGRGYIAAMSPEPLVVASAAASGAIAEHAGHFVSEETGDPMAREVLTEIFGAEGDTLPAVGSTAARYGSPGVEYVRLGRDDALPTHSCPVCSLTVSGRVCPFCRARLDHDSQETA
ncbi:hypothetical protein [Janibacter alittae]|uniref:Uncharacterized protein n=1 Tax=Janibacter alittae TaxID=3115209 RepID=A0ABZ2MH56_9MICO